LVGICIAFWLYVISTTRKKIYMDKSWIMEDDLLREKLIRRKRQIKRNRAIILKSAKELFLKKGLSSTTMEDIAGYSGFDRRTIYNHFKNKEEIFAALVFEVISDITMVYNEVSLENITPLEKLKQLVLKLLDLYIDNSHLINVFTTEIETNDNRRKKNTSSLAVKNINDYGELESRLMNMIKEAQDADQLIDVHPFILAGLLNEIILRSVIVLHQNKRIITKEDIIRDLLRIIEGNLIKGTVRQPENKL
jgi:AcrR family transcriptional regulator